MFQRFLMDSKKEEQNSTPIQIWRSEARQVCKEVPRLIYFKDIRNWHEREQCSLKMFFCDSYPLPMYECDLCEFKTDFKVTLHNHNRVVHEEKQDNSDQKSILVCNRCNNCNFETYSLLVVTKHVQICNKTSKNGPKKPTYRKIDHDKWYEYRSSYGGKWCKCKYCSYFSRYTTSIKIHVLSKHTAFEDIVWFKCEFCCYKSKQKGNLKTHIAKQHGQQKQSSYWREKLGSCVEEAASWFECERCSYKSKYKSSLNRHIWGVHGNPEHIDWLQCKYCSFLTKRKFCLENHLFRNHYPGGPSSVVK